MRARVSDIHLSPACSAISRSKNAYIIGTGKQIRPRGGKTSIIIVKRQAATRLRPAFAAIGRSKDTVLIRPGKKIRARDGKGKNRAFIRPIRLHPLRSAWLRKQNQSRQNQEYSLAHTSSSIVSDTAGGLKVTSLSARGVRGGCGGRCRGELVHVCFDVIPSRVPLGPIPAEGELQSRGISRSLAVRLSVKGSFDSVFLRFATEDCAQDDMLWGWLQRSSQNSIFAH